MAKQSKPRRSALECATDRVTLLKAKLEAQQLQAALAYYTGADKGRRNKDWRAPNVSADQALIPELQTLVARSRHATSNTWVGRAARRSFVRNVVGRGIMVVPTPKSADGKDLPDLQKLAAAKFMRWASSARMCDIEKRRTFWEIQRTVAGEKFVAGGSYIVWSIDTTIKDNSPLRLQMMEVEQLNQDLQSFEGNQVRSGVEIDDHGAAVGYHFWERNPNDYLSNNRKSTRIDASRVLAYYDAERVLQTVGEPAMACVLQDIRDFSSMREATLWRRRLESCIGLVIKTLGGVGNTIVPPTSGDNGQTASGMTTSDFVPGMVARLKPGEDVTTVLPSAGGNDYEPFNDVTLRGIGAGIGQSYGALTRKNVGDYSSARQDMLEDGREIEPEQDGLIDHQVLPIYEMWFTFAVWHGVFDDELDYAEFIDSPETYVDAEYIPPVRPWIDPEKEVNAYEKALQNRLITRKEIIAQRGGRFETVIEHLQQERKAAAAVGITFPEDVKEQAELAAAKPALMEPAPPPESKTAQLEWITMPSGTHVDIGQDGTVDKGPSSLKGSFVEPDEHVGPGTVNPLNEITDKNKYRQLVDKLGSTGWKGNPLLVEPYGDGLQGLTGSHRTHAAKTTGVDVPVVHLDKDKWADFLENENEPHQSFADYINSQGGADDDIRLDVLKKVGDARALHLMEEEVKQNSKDFSALRRVSCKPMNRRASLAQIDAPSYRPAELDLQKCSTCSLAVGMYCKAYDFNFTAGYVCDAWEASPPTETGVTIQPPGPQKGDAPLDNPASTFLDRGNRGV